MPFTPEQAAAKTKITKPCDNARNDMALGYADAVAAGRYFNPWRLLMKERAALDALMRPPSYDLTKYKLAMPVNDQGLYEGLSATAYDMLNLPAVASEFFTVFPNSVVFDVPYWGAATKSVHRTRCEMVGIGDEEFYVDEYDCRYMPFRFPLCGALKWDEVVFRQYHCHSFPMLKMKRVFNGTGWDVRAFVKKSAEAGAVDTVYPIAQNIPVGYEGFLVTEWIPNPQELRIQFGNYPEICVPMNYPVTDDSGNRLLITPVAGVYWQKDMKVGEPDRKISFEVFK